ncbi:MAG: amino acid transporter [Desulfobulbus sp.]|nr:MAG: amino acid transporter [Desulfobulbus sp.]
MIKNTRTVGLAGALAIGIGGMVGGGIFAVLGEAVSLAHGATCIAFTFAGVVALLTASSYAWLSVANQNRGGTVAFIDQAFQHNLLSGSVNMMLWLCYLVTIALYASAFASYGQTFFTARTPFSYHLLISVAIILPTLINLVSSSFVAKSEFAIVCIKVALLLLIIFLSFPYVDGARLAPANWESPMMILSAGMIIFVAYEGFELIANASEDIKEPAKNLPRAFYGSVFFVLLLYVLISLVTVGAVAEGQLLEAKDYALALAARPALGKTGFTLVAIAALLSTFSAINATIYGNARLSYVLAREGELPSFLGTKKHEMPRNGVLATTVCSLIIANTLPLNEIAILGSAGFLLIFAIVNLSAWKLRREIQGKPLIIVFSCLFSTAALLILLTHTFTTEPRAILIFFFFVVFATAFEAGYGIFIRKHIFHRLYHDTSPDSRGRAKEKENI